MLQNIHVTGNIIVNTPGATINNNGATATVDIIVNGVKVNTWNENVSGNNIVFKSVGTTLNIGAEVTVNRLTLDANDAKVTFVGTAKVGQPIEVKAPATIISDHIISTKVSDKVKLIVKAKENEEGIVVTGDGSETTVQVNPENSTRVNEILNQITNDFIASIVYTGDGTDGPMEPVVKAIKGLLDVGEDIKIDYTNIREPIKDENGIDLPYFPELKFGEYKIILYIDGAMASKTIDRSVIKVSTESGLKNAQKYDIAKIILANDLEVTEQVLITKPKLTIDGNKFIISTAREMAYLGPNKSVISILNVEDVRVSNLTVDAAKVNTDGDWDGIYALQVYKSEDVALTNVTLSNADAGLLVNGSQVIVDSINTTSNEFGGIEVSQGKDTSNRSELTIKGSNNHNDKVNANIWVIRDQGRVIDPNNYYSFAQDGRDGKEDYTNYWNNGSNPFPKAEDPILIAPTDGLKELEVEGLTADNVGYLVFGLNEEESNVQKIASLEEVKTYIDEKYKVSLNSSAIKIEDGKISIVESVLTTDDWNKVKINGEKSIPYRITILSGGKTSKVAKIAMYQDGVAVIEDLR